MNQKGWKKEQKQEKAVKNRNKYEQEKTIDKCLQSVYIYI